MEILSPYNLVVVLKATMDHFVTLSGISNKTKYFHLTTVLAKSGILGILNCFFKELLLQKKRKYYHLPYATSIFLMK